MRECDDTVDCVENEDGDHGDVEDPPAPDSIGPNDAQNEQGDRDLACCKAKDNPRLGNPVDLENVRLLLGSEFKYVPETAERGIVG